jgi:hypothetical protein
MAEEMLESIIDGYNSGYSAAVAAGDLPSTAVTAQAIINVITQTFEDTDLQKFALALTLAKAIERLPADSAGQTLH